MLCWYGNFCASQADVSEAKPKSRTTPETTHFNDHQQIMYDDVVHMFHYYSIHLLVQLAVNTLLYLFHVVHTTDECPWGKPKPAAAFESQQPSKI